MVVLSTLRPILSRASSTVLKDVGKRYMSEHRTFPLTPSRWQWIKFKDFLHFYFMLGIIPITAVITYVNVFIGPATLSEIPEGYTPKYWEYYRHPITRFIAKYMLSSPQQDYEKYMHFVFEEQERVLLRRLEKKIKALMAERQDYQAYYYRPVIAKYHRISREAADYLETIRGD